MTRPMPRIAKNLPAPVKQRRDGMSSKHLAMIRQLPCVVSDVVGHTEAHHLLRSGEHGMGRKSSDQWAVPLSAEMHLSLHRRGDEDAWFSERGIDGRALARALWAARGDLDRMRAVVFKTRQLAALKLRETA